MSSTRDSAGRPIVVVTGMGIVTSLGAGKADNWAKLTAGKSGIHADHPLRHRRTARPRSPAPSISCRSSPTPPPALSERLARRWSAEEAIAESGIGAPRRLPRPAVSRRAAGRDRMAAAHRGRQGLRRQRCTSAMTTCCALRAAGQLQRATMRASCSARSPTISPTHSAPRARRFRCRPPAPPAPPRSSSASRRSAAAKPMPRSASAPTARSIRNR